MLDYLAMLAGQFAMDNALKLAISASVVEWTESFSKLTASDAMKVIAHCVWLSTGGKSIRAVSPEFDLPAEHHL